MVQLDTAEMESGRQSTSATTRKYIMMCNSWNSKKTEKNISAEIIKLKKLMTEKDSKRESIGVKSELRPGFSEILCHLTPRVVSRSVWKIGNAGAAHDSSGPIWRQHKRPISYPLKPEALPQQALSLG